jgi:hypothetical protein
MDAVPARITITAGPDAGRSFGLPKELTHIGRGAENDIALSDPKLPDHQASIASRGGRYAIYVPADQQVMVDGSPVPVERWVWLPMTALLRFGSQTQCEFSVGPLPGGDRAVSSLNASTVTVPTVTAPVGAASLATAPPPLPPADAGTNGNDATGTDRKPLGKSAAAKRKKSVRKAEVARFITDQPGDPLVRLGEDGKLPELELADAGQRPRSERAAEKNPMLLYGVLTCSFVMSLGMLLLDSGPARVTSQQREEARLKLQEFFGEEGEPIEPYQMALRRALIENSQGEYREEKREYSSVLKMLNAADIRDPANGNGLTGRHTGRGRSSDEDLRKYLEVLLLE